MSINFYFTVYSQKLKTMRRHDLDWLRVIAFGLLIFYHVGMIFVPWNFHIKNNVTYDWLVYPMWFLNQWRLPLLFIISGMGTYFSLQKRSGGQFIWERHVRLLIPFIFGMLFLIPPQVYIERLYRNQFSGTYIDYWPSRAFIGIYPEGNISWHHLWFILYLFLFSVMLAPLFVWTKNGLQKEGSVWHRLNRRLKKLIVRPYGLYIFIVPLFIFELLLEPLFPVTHALIDDWFNLINSMILFLFGFILITAKDCFWLTVERRRKQYLIIGIISFSLMLFITHNFSDSLVRHTVESLVKVINIWSWILALFGFAARYLNRPGKTLSYANQAVYPFYILHQTVMIIAGYYLINSDWPLVLKASVLIVATFGISWLSYEFLIRRWKYIRPLFGLKN